MVVAKLIESGIARNGSQRFTYYYNRERFQDFSSFDAREIRYGQKFLIFIDSVHPRKRKIIRPLILISSLDDVPDNLKDYLRTDNNDLVQLENIPFYDP